MTSLCSGENGDPGAAVVEKRIVTRGPRHGPERAFLWMKLQAVSGSLQSLEIVLIADVGVSIFLNLKLVSISIL